jgi:hypothetical protein
MELKGLECHIVHRPVTDVCFMTLKYCQIKVVNVELLHCTGNSHEHIFGTCSACLSTVGFNQKNRQHRNPGYFFLSM